MAPTPPYTTGEVAALFRVDPSTVVRWAESGRLAYFLTPGGQRRFPREQIDVLVAAVDAQATA